MHTHTHAHTESLHDDLIREIREEIAEANARATAALESGNLFLWQTNCNTAGALCREIRILELAEDKL